MALEGKDQESESTTTTSRRAERILVTGGTGLVGSAIGHLINECKGIQQREFRFLSSKDADLTDLAQVRRVFDEFKPTAVIHLAAMVGGLFRNLKNNLDFLLVNLKINENVLQLAYEHQVDKCISCLSTCIFPDCTQYPINERMVHNGPPHKSNFGYSYGKRFVDILNQAYMDKQKQDASEAEHKSVFTAIIPTNVYGPNDNFNLEDSHVIPGLIHRAYLEAQKSLQQGSKQASLTVLGSGSPMRQFIYSLDLARLILWTLDIYEETEPIILSVDETDEISIAAAAIAITSAIEVKLGVKFKLQFDRSFSDGQIKKTASNAKLRSYLPDFQFMKFKQGVQATVDWFCDNYASARK